MTCPHCYAPIDHLGYNYLQWEGGWYVPDDFHSKWQGDVVESEFFCPVCTIVLFEDHEDAEKFFNEEGPWIPCMV